MGSLKPQWISYASTGIFATSQASLFVLYPYLAECMRLELSTVVACFSAGSFLFLIGGPAWSWISLRYGAGFALRSGLVGLTLSLVLLLIPITTEAGSAGLNLALLILSRAIYGLAASGIPSVTQAILANHSERESRVRVLATQAMVQNGGRLLGPVLAILLVTHSPQLLFIIPAALSLALAGLPYARLSPTTTATDEYLTQGPVSSSTPWREILTLGLITTAMLGILQSNLAGYLQASWKLSATEAASLMARLMILGSLSMMGAQLVLYQRKHQGRKALAGGAWLIAIGFLCLLNTDQISLVYVAVFLVSLGVAWLTPSYTAILSLATDRQEAAAGALAVVHKIGYASGGLVTAAALYFNPDLPFVIAAALAFAAIALVQLALRAALRHSSSNPLEGGSSHAG